MLACEKLFYDNLTWPPRPMIWEWARENIVLTPRQATPFPGPYRVDLTPQLKGIYAALQDAKIHTVILCKGAQAGATLLGYVWVCYCIAEEPGPILIVMPNEKLAQSASESRLQPMIKDSPRMADELPSDPDAFKKLEYQFTRTTLNWVGSNSPANLASRPVRYLLLDEVDKYPTDSAKEANSIALAIQRTKTFWNRKILMMSTPTVPDGTILRYFDRGDQRRYFVPCPHCKAMQFLKWGQIKFDSKLSPDDAARSAYYECESCHQKINDEQRTEAIKAGEWRATAQAKDSGMASFHLPSLYSPWMKWGTLVRNFLNAKDHPDMLHDFINSELAEGWEPETRKVGENIVSERAAEYQKGQRFSTHPSFGETYKGKASIVVVSVDVQKDYFWWLMREWVVGGDSGLIDYGKFHSWEDLNKLANDNKASYVMVDCGYGERVTETYEACIKYRFIPCAGAVAKMTSMTWTQSTINPYEGTRQQKQGVSIQRVTHDTISEKLQLMDRVTGASPFRWYVYRNIEDDYCKQLVSEEYIDDRWELRRGYRSNHLLDCEVLQLLAATIAGFNTKTFKQ